MAKHGVQTVFSDRQGGISAQPFDSLNLGYDLGDTSDNVYQNMEILLGVSGVPVPHQAKQTHGANVLFCSGAGVKHNVEADILVATEKRVALAVRIADCLPMLLADKEAGIVAVVHAGWRGTVAKVGQKAVRAMVLKGAKVENIIASLGPCIQDCCFETSAEIGRWLSASCGHDVITRQELTYFANLHKTNVFQLINMGLKDENIEVINVCTSCNTQPQYFSYRRDCGKTGRQLAIIHLP